MANYNPEHETVLNDALKNVKNVEAEKMFGFPAYRANGTMAVSVKKEGIIAKVGEKRAQELIGKDGVTAYEPLPGRIWKEWVLLTSNFDKHKGVMEEAVKYAGSGNTKTKDDDSKPKRPRSK